MDELKKEGFLFINFFLLSLSFSLSHLDFFSISLLKHPNTSNPSPQGYLEVDLDVHAYAFLARRALTAFLSRLSSVVFDNALVVEGRREAELPEAVLCCARVARVDFEVARPFPATADPEEAIAAAAAFAAEEAAKLQKAAAAAAATATAAEGEEASSSSTTAAADSGVGVLRVRPPLGSAPWRPSTVEENFGGGKSLPMEGAASSSISVVLSGVAPGTPRAAAAAAAASAAAGAAAAGDGASSSSKR